MLTAIAQAIAEAVLMDGVAIAVVTSETLGTGASAVVSDLSLSTDLGRVATAIHAMAATGGRRIADRRGGQ